MDRKYKYLGYFFLLLIPLIFAGFYQSYFKTFPNFGKNFDIYLHLHSIIATIWVAILIVQPFLIANKKVAIHRTVGKLSYIVFPLLILSFIPRIIKTFNAGEYPYLFFPIVDGTLLILFYGLAIYHKKKTGKHMRYMIASALVLLGPTVGRIGPHLFGWSELLTQNIQYLMIDTILISLILYDKKNHRQYQPYLVTIALFFVHQIIYHLVFL
ncbi:MAG: hypothetical protein ABJB11_08290 [Ferruginibacter sp.]